MIVHANSRMIGTDPDGSAQFIKSIGENVDTVSVTDETMIRYLFAILKEMKKMNIYLSTLTEERISDADIAMEVE